MKKEKIKNILFWLSLGVLFLIGIFLMFYKLDIINIEKWDEARHGINAYEMIKNKNYIVNTYNYQVDYWNLKPPLSYWLIILGYKIFGYNMIGFKIYSPIAFIILFAVIAVFMYKKYGKLSTLCALLFILTVHVFIQFHMARYADADMIFSLFYISSFCSLIASFKNRKWFCMSGLMFSLAFLSKSYHATTIIICTAVTLLITKEYKKFKLKDYVLYLLFAAVPVLIWAALRFRNDGITFFYNMIFVDIFNRSTSVGAGGSQPVYYYFIYLIYILIIPIAVTALSMLLTFIGNRTEIRGKFKLSSEILIYVVWIIIPILIYTISKTKFKWYIYPQIFLTAMLLGKCYSNLRCEKRKVLKLVSVALLVLPLGLVIKNVNTIYNIKGEHPEEEFLISAIDRSDTFADKDFYCDITQEVPTEEYYLQDIFLTAELYGDMLCHNGGVNEFSQSKDAYLLISKENYDKNLQVLKDSEVIAKDTQYLLLKH